MKKVVVAFLFTLMMLFNCVTAMAVYSPELPTEIESENPSENSSENPSENPSGKPDVPRKCRRWPTRDGYCYDYGYGETYVVYRGSGSGNVVVVDMSPKTGYSNSYAILAVFGILTCGGVAVFARKKMKETD